MWGVTDLGINGPFVSEIESLCVHPTCTFYLDSRRVGSSRLLSPSPPVLTEALGLRDEGAQGVLLKPVRVLEGEPLSILPFREHEFHYIRFYLPLSVQDSQEGRSLSSD